MQTTRIICKSEKSQNINDHKGDLGESSKRRNKQCFFLQAVVHGAISLSSAVVDGETHRGKLMSPEIWERIEEFLNFTTDGASGTFLLFEPYKNYCFISIILSKTANPTPLDYFR